MGFLAKTLLEAWAKCFFLYYNIICHFHSFIMHARISHFMHVFVIRQGIGEIVHVFHFKYFINYHQTFWQSEVKISVLALWLCALSSLFHNMGLGGYGRYPLFVRARHVQRCVKKCPNFECVIHRFVLALNAGKNTPQFSLVEWQFK